MNQAVLRSWNRRAIHYGIAVGILFAVQVAGADLAFAQSGGGSGAFAPLQTAVQMIVDFITGPFGRLLAIIAVIGLGFLAFAGRLSWFTAGAVVIGMGLVFGAPAIVDQLIAAVGNN
ncbi:TrbC/VirB2 family protein [Mesorhizobium sp. 2RAF21]|uniref:TrbC/VirB2 family protein n=1 Tax=Mesorhizobium sp. 2RAF21 TaxID=3232995 RepID=UPI003F99E8BE